MKKLPILFMLLLTLILIMPAALANQIRDNQPTKIVFSDKSVTDGHLVLGVYAEGKLGFYGNQIEESSNGGLTYAINATEFKAEKMTTQLITAPIGSGFKQILWVGLGNKDQV